jgi:hypothetical protein
MHVDPDIYLEQTQVEAIVNRMYQSIICFNNNNISSSDLLSDQGWFSCTVQGQVAWTYYKHLPGVNTTR